MYLLNRNEFSLNTEMQDNVLVGGGRGNEFYHFMPLFLTYGYPPPPASLFVSKAACPHSPCTTDRVTGSLETEYCSVLAGNIRSSSNHLFLCTWQQWDCSACPSLRQAVQKYIPGFALKTEHSFLCVFCSFSSGMSAPQAPCALSQNQDLPNKMSEVGVMSKPSIWLGGFLWC